MVSQSKLPITAGAQVQEAIKQHALGILPAIPELTNEEAKTLSNKQMTVLIEIISAHFALKDDFAYKELAWQLGVDYVKAKYTYQHDAPRNIDVLLNAMRDELNKLEGLS